MALRGLALAWIVVLGMGVGSGQGQMVAGMGADSAGTPRTVEAALHAMSDRAAVVFVGTVMAVRRVGADPASAAAGVVEIDFAVEQGVRGCATGGTYTLREWSGMWAGTAERYRVGQRMFLMLHAPSASGLSSPVGGPEGAMPVRGGGQTVGEGDRTTGVQRPVVDLRWVGAKLGRPVVYRKEAPRRPVQGLGFGARAMLESGPAGSGVGGSAAPAPVDAVVVSGDARAAVGAEQAAASMTDAAVPVKDAAVPVKDAAVPVKDAAVPVKDAAVPVKDTAAPQASVAAQEAAVSSVLTMVAGWKRATDAATR